MAPQSTEAPISTLPLTFATPVVQVDSCWRADEVPVDRLHGGGVVLDASPLVFISSTPIRDFQLEASQLTSLASDWEVSHRRGIPRGAFIFIHTGWGRFWSDEEKYLGNNVKDTSDLHFPGLHPDAASWLLDQYPDISMVGIDTASIDFGGSSQFMAHRILLGANVPVLENVANLHKLLEEEKDSGLDKPIQIVALPMKIRDGSGGPTRVVGILSPSASSSSISAVRSQFGWREFLIVLATRSLQWIVDLY